jgi:hypothetical protein
MSIRKFCLRILLCTSVASALFVIVVGALFVNAVSYEPMYDEKDPDYSHYKKIFDDVEEELYNRRSGHTSSIDFSPLNDGEWSQVCLLGAYSNALNCMTNLGAEISKADEQRLADAGQGRFRLAQVEEQEIMIAYVDLRNRAHFIHFRRGFGKFGDDVQGCISKPDTLLFFSNCHPRCRMANQ